MPPDVQAYFADRYVARPQRKKGRPSKHPGQLESDQLREAGDLFAAVHKIRTEGRLSEAKACAKYAKIDGLKSAKSVVRRYQAAKKKLRALFEAANTDEHRWFLSYEDYIDWETANLKKVAKNK